jgi:putative endonuclease
MSRLFFKWQSTTSLNDTTACFHFVISTEVEKSLTIRIVARDYSFWVYIVTNRNHSVLYIGVTNSLSRRTWQHREGTGAAFPAAYRCTKLIYYERYRDIRDAIARETQLKKWSRAKKIELTNRLNPRWMDISDQIFGE